MFDHAAVLELYNKNHFSRAGELTKAHLRTDIDKDRYTPEELILLGRLSFRLGGSTLRRHFFRAARNKAPEHPMVIYFARYDRPGTNTLDLLRDFEARPMLPGASRDIQAVWLAGIAGIYSQFRDFDRAHTLIDQALALTEEDQPWVLTCKSDILCNQDRWSEARDCAREAWTLRPGTPGTAISLGRSHTRLQGLASAWELYEELDSTCNSWEICNLSLYYLLAESERSNASRKRELLARAAGKIESLPSLMPLADRQSRRLYRLAKIDHAMLSGDLETLRQSIPLQNSRFFKEIFKTISTRGPETSSLAPVFVPYKEVRQKYLTCLPSSINAASLAWGPEFELDHDLMAKEVSFDGTGAWRARDWLVAKGWKVSHFLAEPGVLRRILDRGFPVVLTREYHLHAHAMVVAGHNPAYGTLYLHDPSQERLVEILDSGFDDAELPFGPLGMILVPPGKESLDHLLEGAEHGLSEILLETEKILELQGPGTALEFLRDKTAGQMDHPRVRRLEARLLGHLNHLPEALAIQTGLLDRHPDAMVIQRDLINSWHLTRDNASLVRFFETLLEKGTLETTRSIPVQDGLPPGYLAQYADYLGTHREGFAKARKLLLKGLATIPVEASLLHILGDVLEREGQLDEAELPLRLAAWLKREDHHYTRAYADHLRRLGQETAALAFLKARLEWAKPSLESPLVHIQLADALEDWGMPGPCAQVLEEGLALHGKDSNFLAWMCNYCMRTGDLTKAASLLETLSAQSSRETWLGTAIQFKLRTGNWQEALDLSEAWILEFPHSPAAARSLAQTLPYRDGYPGMITRIMEIVKAHPNHEEYIRLAVQALETTSDTRAKEEFLRNCLEHNPRDLWCLLELGALVVEAGECAGATNHHLHEEAKELLARLTDLNPQHGSVLGLRARLEFLEGQVDQAVESLFFAASVSPWWVFPYRRLAEILTLQSGEARSGIARRLQESLIKIPGTMIPLADVLKTLAKTQGYPYARTFLDGVSAGRALDSAILEAHMNLELEYGQGSEGHLGALELAIRGQEAFPGHQTFLSGRIRCLRALERYDEALPLLESLIARDPCNEWAIRLLASSMEGQGLFDQALVALETGVARNPLDSSLCMALSSHYQSRGLPEKALASLEAGLARNPHDISLRSHAIETSLAAGSYQKAVDIAREGTIVFPDGAYLWFLYGEAMHNSPYHNNLMLIEEAYRKALSLNRQLFTAADLCAVILCLQFRHEEALALLETAHQDNPEDDMPYRGRRAWILRQWGKTEEAWQVMGSCLEDYPAYLWGWSIAMNWLSKDNDGKRTLSMLSEPIPALETSSSMTASRLQLLGKAGRTWDRLAPEWAQASALFTTDDEFQYRYFDVLVEQNLTLEAQAVLDSLVHRAGTDAAFRVRQAQLQARQADFGKMTQILVEAYRDTLPGSPFPHELAWSILDDPARARAFAEGAFKALESGTRLRPEGIEASWRCLARNRGPVYDQTWVECRDKITGFLGKVEEATDPKALMRAAALDGLISLEYLDAAILYLRNNYDVCRQHPDLWCVCTRLFHDKAFTIGNLEEWFEGWENKHGLSMWNLANYLNAKPLKSGVRLDRKFLASLGETAQRGLELLPLDHTRQFLAANAVEGTHRSGSHDQAMALLAEWRDTMADKTGQLWQPGYYQDVPAHLSRALELSEARGAAFREKALAICFERYSSGKAWILAFNMRIISDMKDEGFTRFAFLGLLGTRWLGKTLMDKISDRKNH